MEKVFERRVRCKCGRQLIHMAEVRLWNEEVIDSSAEPSRPWDNAVPVSPISPPEHSSGEEASRSRYGHRESPWTTAEPSWTEALAEASSWRFPDQSWEGAAQDTGEWGSWNMTNPSSSAQEGPRNSQTRVLEDQKPPRKKFEPTFTPETLQECLERFKFNPKKKDDLRRCDQCNEWPKQKSPGTPVVLCQECWDDVKDTNFELYRDYVRRNDEFEHA